MANNNLSPKIRTLNWAYEVMGLKSDATPVRSFTFMISLYPDDYPPGTDIEGLKGALTALETVGSNVPLLKLAMGELAPVGSEIKVHMDKPYAGQRAIGDTRDPADSPKDSGGWVQVTFSERL